MSIRYGKSSGLKRGFKAAGSALRRKSTMDWQKLKTLLYQPLVLLEKVVKREVEGPRRPVLCRRNFRDLNFGTSSFLNI
jgi:hypothetical protein